MSPTEQNRTSNKSDHTLGSTYQFPFIIGLRWWRWRWELMHGGLVIIKLKNWIKEKIRCKKGNKAKWNISLFLSIVSFPVVVVVCFYDFGSRWSTEDERSECEWNREELTYCRPTDRPTSECKVLGCCGCLCSKDDERFFLLFDWLKTTCECYDPQLTATVFATSQWWRCISFFFPHFLFFLYYL